MNRRGSKHIPTQSRMLTIAAPLWVRVGFILGVLVLSQMHKMTSDAMQPRHGRRIRNRSRYLNADDDRHGADPEEEDASNGPISGFSALVSCYA